MSVVTAADIISPALERINVKDPADDLDSADATTAIRYLNDMMLSMADLKGIQLGYTIVSATTDEITAPDWSHGWMRAKLSIIIADEYGKDITAGLVALAEEYESGIRRRCIRLRPTSLPDGLPTGQGNSAYSSRYGYGNNFFHDTTADDLKDDLGETLTDENGDPAEDQENLLP
jgi:hypothetical protein